MQRRTFVKLSVAATLGAALYGCSQHDPLRYPQSLSVLCDEEELKAIGTAYRKKFAPEDSVKKLTDLLQNNISGDDDFVINALHQRNLLDFSEEKTVVLRGWVLSQTEARQCALLSLNQ